MASSADQTLSPSLDDQALRQNAARFRTMVDASPLGVFITGPDGQYQYVNAKLEQITQTSSDVLRVMGLSPLIHPDDRANFDAAWEATRLTPGHLDQVYKLALANGQVIWIHLRAAPVFHDDKLDGYIGKVEDITRQRQQQAELRQVNAILAQRNEDMEELLSITAHDLKHPVVGIQGLLTLLKEDCYDKLDADSRQNLDLSLGECDRMKEMLNRLSKLGHIEQTRPQVVPTSLRDVVDTCVKRYQAITQHQGVTLRVDAAQATIPMPRAIIEECLSNLIDNALKYGCPGPQSIVDIQASMQDQACLFRVRDYGAGIDPLHHQRIFRPFRRLAGPSAAPGSGIGLTAVKRLIQRIGGNVTVDSAPGQGACFEMRFPPPPEQSPEHEPFHSHLPTAEP